MPDSSGAMPSGSAASGLATKSKQPSANHGEPGASGDQAQPAARRLSRRLRRAARALRVHRRLRAAVPFGLIPITKGIPPLRQYINVLPFIAVLVPLGFQLQGLYRLRRGRSRVDDFFAVFVGSILAVVFGIVATLYVQTYFATNAAKDTGAFEVSQAVWAIFLVLNVVLTFASRELMREVLERRWRAGIGLKRILIAGSGELGRLVADKILEHRELGYQIVGFVDDRAGRRPSRLSRPAAARHDRRSGRDRRARVDRSPVCRAAARAARAHARAARQHEPRRWSTSRSCPICCR